MVSIGLIAALATRPWQAISPGRVPPTADSAARRLVLEANEQAKYRDPAHCQLAISTFAQATEKDAAYAAAWGGLAITRALCALFGAASHEPALEFMEAKTASEAALRRDPKSWEAHTAYGMVRLFHEQNFAEPEREFDLAARYDPTRYEPWLFRAWYYLAMNNIDSAIRSIRHAKELAPIGAR
jgi:tetratricopeptide (TPR) repeat protein